MKRFRRLIALCAVHLIAFGASPLPSSAETWSPDETRDFVAQLAAKREKHGSFTAHFTEEKFAGVSKSPIQTEGTIQFTAPNLMRREVIGKHPSLMTSNGKELWIHYPNLGEAERYSLSSRNPAAQAIQAFQSAVDFSALPDHFTIRATKNGELVALHLEPRRPGLRRAVRTIVLHFNSTPELIGMEVSTSNGNVIRTRYSQISHEAIPAETFTFEPPAGTQITKIGS